MPVNVEIKARVSNTDELVRRVRELSDDANPTELLQEDTFFTVSNGRLKLREIQGEPMADLIYYDRPDSAGPKVSNHIHVPISDPADLKAALAASIGIKGVVKKRRLLFMIGQTRVHIDDVHGLGNFMELEVCLKEGDTMEVGQQIANDLMKKLNIDPSDLLTGAYMEMILSGSPSDKAH